MELLAGEEPGPGLRCTQTAAESGPAGHRDERGGRGCPEEPSPLCSEARGAAWGGWSPAVAEDVTESLLRGCHEPPGRSSALADGQGPPTAPDPALPHEESPLPAEGSPGLESSSSSTLSLSGEDSETASSESTAPGLCCAPAGSEDECPICTEPYDNERHKAALLNCNHGLCHACLRAIMDTADGAEFGRVRCPICRQKTPMLEWEICKLQEELLLLHAEPGPPTALTDPRPPVLPPRRPGLAGALEHHFQVRFHTSRMFGCLPCVRYPAGLIRALGRLQGRCRCCYLLLLALLLVAELLSLLLIFLPIVLMVLLFLILDK
ncbi:ring finger protein-like [Tympanuchus pallidicinctus]|uniref:ring finger protein-like n=1 Tax=Tympanuchus pallidicinctus TaxID=109042 RepID=UPI002286ECF3|nr:ring finger protein-like [Tympanuchus pallidicinctus]